MNRQYPIYTIQTECQDCYKCVRQCPVKAIKVREGHAAVIPERCVACGHCVEVCPAQAKHVRNDRGRARRLLRGERPVLVSLAPSWISEFPELDESQIVAAIRSLGIEGVSETALGAQEVSARLVRDFESGATGLHISSACPAAVAFVHKYLPQLSKSVTPLASPLLAHARLLREHFGDEIAIIFFGPCVAKKIEADAHPDLLQLALTFNDLRRMWEEAEIDPARCAPTPKDRFVPENAEEGTLYPIAGGMLEALRTACMDRRVEMLDLAGLRQMDNALAGLNPEELDGPVFVECLSCDGGCVNGPCMSRDYSGLKSLLEVRRRANTPSRPRQRPIRVDSSVTIHPTRIRREKPSEACIRDALRQVGKRAPDDELNCGGCGYESCRQFAVALLEGNAETAMCVSHMRSIAQQKANALLRCIPLGVVIVNADLRIIECNQLFAEMFGKETEEIFGVLSSLSGAVLHKLLPYEELFEAVLRSGEDVSREYLLVGDRLVNLTIFSIEPQQTVGAVLQDVTEVEMHREQIARKAREVIERNMYTVQEIACRLGEHMADTEVLLKSIATDYRSDRLIDSTDREEEST